MPAGLLHTGPRAGGHSQGCAHERSTSDRSKPPKPSPFWSFLAREREWQVGKFLCTPTSVRTGRLCCGQTFPKPQLLDTRPVSYSMTCPWWVQGLPGSGGLRPSSHKRSKRWSVLTGCWWHLSCVRVSHGTPMFGAPMHMEATGLLGEPGAPTLPCPLPATVPDVTSGQCSVTSCLQKGKTKMGLDPTRGLGGGGWKGDGGCSPVCEESMSVVSV